MSEVNAERLQDLKVFLRSIQRPGLSLEQVKPEDNIVQIGLIDSLALIQITLYLERKYNIDFSLLGFNPEQLSSMSNILQLIEESAA
ncbi:Phosphopantetheine attachment site [Pseudomonas pohangensis]|jgi:acyl carrier protein|uniref:Phosphopantetheine attachment site n=1 Tax=Pseudomonas pohangensis TaxID=364197 RepID=A0A1H2EZ82_9PSED|nr:acyl carrier protein [Pseudomonas pohangensis]SDU00028.1 Phosphopantetheine attachment site [Pseudomonas pohangensis]